jgi:hypothetical protein
MVLCIGILQVGHDHFSPIPCSSLSMVALLSDTCSRCSVVKIRRVTGRAEWSRREQPRLDGFIGLRVEVTSS